MNIGGTCLTEDQAKTICERIADGQSLLSICRDTPDMPSTSTIYDALAADKTFSDKYARAREVQADKLAAEIVEIADDSRNDTQVDDEGNEIVNHDHIARARLRVDARKWYASKVAPKKYGDRLTHDGDANNPVAVAVTYDAKTLARAMLATIAKAETDDAS